MPTVMLVAVFVFFFFILQKQEPRAFAPTPDTTKVDRDSPREVKRRVEAAEEILKELAAYGAERPRSYLILSQDPLEIRPTGGFPGTYGELTVYNGDIVKLLYDDLWKLDKPLKERNRPQVNQASWWSHFPKAAESAMGAYKDATGVELDGVVALTPTAMRYILSVIGSVDVPEYSTKVDKDNLLDEILLRSPYLGEQLSPTMSNSTHKSFMSVVAQRIEEKLFSISSFYRRQELAEAVMKAMDEKQLLVFFRNGKAQKMLSDEGWSGEIKKTDGDFLLISDYNAGINKTNAFVDRSTAYSVKHDSKGPYASLVLTYEFKDKPRFKRFKNLYTKRYQAYRNILRIYVPKGSSIIGVSGFDQPVTRGMESGKAVFQSQLLLFPGDKRKYSIKYRLPVMENDYTLIIQKQPGTPIEHGNSSYPLRFSYEPPNGKRIASYFPKELSIDRQKAVMASDYAEDRVLDIQLADEL